MTWSPIGPQTVGTSPARPKKNLGEANNHGVQARPLRTVSLLDSNMANILGPLSRRAVENSEIGFLRIAMQNFLWKPQAKRLLKGPTPVGSSVI